MNREIAARGAQRLAWHADKAANRTEFLRRKNDDARSESPEDWATCTQEIAVEGQDEGRVCGASFKPGERDYKMCWPCSNRERVSGLVRCIFCDNMHAVKFPACYVCRLVSDYATRAPQLRAMVLTRDGFTCQMCGDDEADVLQVDHVQPCKAGGGANPWNLESLCVPCVLTRWGQYGLHDEMEQWYLIEAYATYLSEFLSAEERYLLQLDAVDLGGSWFEGQARGVGVPDLGETTDIEGYLNVRQSLGAVPTDIPPVPVVEQAVVICALPPARLPAPPEDRMPSSAAAMLKLALANDWSARATYALGEWREKSVESVMVQAVRGGQAFEATWVAPMGGKYKLDSARGGPPLEKLDNNAAKAFLAANLPDPIPTT